MQPAYSLDLPGQALLSFDTSVEASLSYLVLSVKSDRRFRYRVDLHTGAALRGYNLLRHAATLNCMMMLPRDLRSAETESAISRSVDYLRQQAVAYQVDGTYCIVANGRAKLGATALALMALLKGDLEDPLEEKLARYLVSQQGPGGDFQSIRLLDDDSKMVGRRSRYYRAQAALALNAFGAKSGLPLYLAAAESATNAVIRSITDEIIEAGAPLHWDVLALERADPKVIDSALPLLRKIASGVSSLWERVEEGEARFTCGAAATRGEALAALIRTLKAAAAGVMMMMGTTTTTTMGTTTTTTTTMTTMTTGRSRRCIRKIRPRDLR